MVSENWTSATTIHRNRTYGQQYLETVKSYSWVQIISSNKKWAMIIVQN